MYWFILSEEETLGYIVCRFIGKKNGLNYLKCGKESYPIAHTLRIIKIPKHCHEQIQPSLLT